MNADWSGWPPDWADAPDFKCPECKGLTLHRDWWDDAPSNGGARLAEQRMCIRCDWHDDS